MAPISYAFSVANGIGILLYAYLMWRIAEFARAEQRPVGDFGDGLTFFFTAFPVLVCFTLINSIWIAVGAVRMRKGGEREAALTGAVAIGAWVFSVLAVRQVL